MPKVCTDEYGILVKTKKNHVSIGTNVAYQIMNCSSELIYLYRGQQHLQSIEQRQVDGDWQRYRLSMLPEAPLAPGASAFVRLAPGESIDNSRYMKWLYLPEQNSHKVIPSGVYRLVITINRQPDDHNVEEIYSNEIYLDFGQKKDGSPKQVKDKL